MDKARANLRQKKKIEEEISMKCPRCGKRLLAVIDQSRGLSNKELSRFTDQIESLCDKYSRK